MLMLPVPIFDRIEIELIESGIELTCSQPGIPTDSSNLVWRAAERFLAKVGSETGVRIHLEKISRPRVASAAAAAMPPAHCSR